MTRRPNNASQVTHIQQLLARRLPTRGRFVGDDLEVDFDMHWTRREGQIIKLQPDDQKILEALAADVGEILSPEWICQHALQRAFNPSAFWSLVLTLQKRMRHNLQLVQTVSSGTGVTLNIRPEVTSMLHGQPRFGLHDELARFKRQAEIERTSEKSDIHIGDLTIDFRTQQVWRNGQCGLTPREFVVLEWLIINQGMVLTDEAIASGVCAAYPEYFPNGYNRPVKECIARLRRKLGQVPVDKCNDYLRTRDQFGFTFAVEPW